MRSSLLLCIFLSFWAVIAQPIDDVNKMIGVWGCLRSPVSNQVEQRLVDSLGEYFVHVRLDVETIRIVLCGGQCASDFYLGVTVAMENKAHRSNIHAGRTHLGSKL